MCEDDEWDEQKKQKTRKNTETNIHHSPNDPNQCSAPFCSLATTTKPLWGRWYEKDALVHTWYVLSIPSLFKCVQVEHESAMQNSNGSVGGVDAY